MDNIKPGEQPTIVCTTEQPKTDKLPAIVFSTYAEEIKSGEQFIPHHGIALIVSGRLFVPDGNRVKTFEKGEYILYRKNYLAKFVKQPLVGEPFQSITVVLDQDTLKKFSNRHRFYFESRYPAGDAVMHIQPTRLLKDFFQSLVHYTGQEIPDHLLQIKREEVIMLLLQDDPSLKNLFFDFSKPGKVDLEAFMNQNFKYNVDIKHFAYLTGRSLASFKRDFEKIYQMSPNRWLQQRRLQEAYYLIKEKKQKPSEVFRELGFERISHFSYSFKQFFGINPSEVHADS